MALLPTDPKRRRVVFAIAGAAVLALVIVLQRRGAPADQAAADATDPNAQTFSTAQPPVGSTFADNGEAAGALTTAVSGGLNDVAGSLDAVNTGLGHLGDQVNSLGELITTPPTATSPAAVAADTTAPGPVGATGSTAATTARKGSTAKPDRFGRTYKERVAIQGERKAGKVDRLGRTATERKVARRSPAFKKELRTRLAKSRAKTPSRGHAPVKTTHNKHARKRGGKK